MPADDNKTPAQMYTTFMFSFYSVYSSVHTVLGVSLFSKEVPVFVHLCLTLHQYLVFRFSVFFICAVSASYGFCQSVFVVNSADVHYIGVSAELTIIQSTVSVDLHVLQAHNFCGPAISASPQFLQTYTF